MSSVSKVRGKQPELEQAAELSTAVTRAIYPHNIHIRDWRHCTTA